MNLHRSGGVPDWEKETEGKQPKYVEFAQKIAKKTNGLITPGNIVSSIGLGLVISGAIDIKNDKRLRGATKTIIGKYFDLGDGMIAEKTKTKSPLGEIVDASFDKIGFAATSLALLQTDIVPKKRLLQFGVQNSVNAFSTLLAKHKGIEIHSTKYGKITWALQGISVTSSMVSANVDNDQNPIISSTFDTIASATALSGNILGTLVSLEYLETAITGESKTTDEPRVINSSLDYYDY